GVEDAQPDVRRTVAEREDPAVAGELVALAGFAVPQLQPRLHERVVVHGRAVVGAAGDGHGAVFTPGETKRHGQARADAVAGDDQRGAIGELVADLAAALVGGTRGDADDAAGPLVDQ